MYERLFYHYASLLLIVHNSHLKKVFHILNRGTYVMYMRMHVCMNGYICIYIYLHIVELLSAFIHSNYPLKKSIKTVS